MRIGVVFPQSEIGADAGAVRAYAARVEEMGYAHILVYDHVVGADPAVHANWRGPYDIETNFHEPFVLFGYLAAVTTTIELVTGIIILPQRQTALVAKQAAEVDVLSGGRLRLGIGVGWNPVEYEALGQDFTTRGRRSAAQVELLRKFWTQPSFSHDDEWDTVTGAGIRPLPVQRPIPIWFGGASDAAYRRAGQLGDGWFPMVSPGQALDTARAVVEDAAGGRPLGMEGRVSWGPDGAGLVVKQIGKWRDAGASHVAINTMGAGLGGVDDHLAALATAASALGLGS